jgi:hypothetical protein
MGAGALLFGASLWLLVSVLIRHEPAGLYCIGCAVAGAVAGVGIVLATQRRTGGAARLPHGANSRA